MVCWSPVGSNTVSCLRAPCSLTGEIRPHGATLGVTVYFIITSEEGLCEALLKLAALLSGKPVFPRKSDSFLYSLLKQLVFPSWTASPGFF